MSKHLLIVEDDELVQSLLAAYMQNAGFKVSLAATGKEMLACIDSESIDLVLLDMILPNMTLKNGIQRAIRKSFISTLSLPKYILITTLKLKLWVISLAPFGN